MLNKIANLGELSNAAALYFRYALKLIAVAQFCKLSAWQYFKWSPDFLKIPILPVLAHGSGATHLALYLLHGVAVACFFFGFAEAASALLISACLGYYWLGDLFFFHHDIFLGTNVFCIYGLLRYRAAPGAIVPSLKPNRALAVLALKLLACSVHLFAGAHKLTAHFLQGGVIEELLGRRILASFPQILSVLREYAGLMAIFVTATELLLPVLLWTRWRGTAMAAGLALHVGIPIFSGAGLMFNLYLPACYLLFLKFEPVTATLPPQVQRLASRLDFGRVILWQSAPNQTFVASAREYGRAAMVAPALHPAIWLCLAVAAYHTAWNARYGLAAFCTTWSGCNAHTAAPSGAATAPVVDTLTRSQVRARWSI